MSDLLRLPVSYDSILHPDVVYAPQGWNGFEYWMACTPYPEGVEDPYVFASHDGLSWEVPSGLVNPIDLHSHGTYNSDPDLTLHDNTLYCVWRLALPGQLETILVSKSSDGVNWTPKQKVFTSAWRMALSPAVTVHDNMFCMYTVNVSELFPTVELRLAERIEGPWEHVGCVDMRIPDVTPWHLDVVHDNRGWFCLLTGNLVEQTSEVYYGKSEDGVRWNMTKQPILYRAEGEYGMYRASGIRSDRGLDIWYSTYDKSKVINTMRHVCLAV